ncbi:WD40-repeat-containing domain protein [Chiua virens]|nr:WD40-repeat-containing domain protein [Chiua virens]
MGGSEWGPVLVWSVERHEQVREMKGHTGGVYAVDISQDGTKIASGSPDKTACIWAQSMGKQLLTLQHDKWVAAVKFSPDGCLLATTAWGHSIRIYHSEDGHLLQEFLIQPGSTFNQCLAWNDDTHLYVISRDGIIHYLDVSIGETHSQWPIRTNGMEKRGCITLPNNHSFIAASAHSSISFWDLMTCMKIGSNINHDGLIWTIAISENYDIAIGHGKKITI